MPLRSNRRSAALTVPVLVPVPVPMLSLPTLCRRAMRNPDGAERRDVDTAVTSDTWV